MRGYRLPMNARLKLARTLKRKCNVQHTPEHAQVLATLERSRKNLTRSFTVLLETIDTEWPGEDRTYIDAQFKLLCLFSVAGRDIESLFLVKRAH